MHFFHIGQGSVMLNHFPEKILHITAGIQIPAQMRRFRCLQILVAVADNKRPL